MACSAYRRRFRLGPSADHGAYTACMSTELTHTDPHTQASGAHAHTARAYAASRLPPPCNRSRLTQRRRPHRRRDPDPLLRRLPLRPAPGAQRVAGRDATVYPCVPGHEIVGRVVAVGQRGDAVQGGRPRRRRLPGRLLPHLRRAAARARAVLRRTMPTFTYNCPDAHRAASPTAATPRASSSTRISCCASRRTLDLAGDGAAAVRRHHHLLAAAALEGRQGQKVGIVGLGGLGHMGVKFAHAFGAHVVAVHDVAGQGARTACGSAPTRSSCPANADEMAKHAGSFDFILDTVSAPHDLNAYLVAARSATAR